MGRHAHPLAAYGYRVLGIDRHLGALRQARRVSGAQVIYVAQDMRRLGLHPGVLDGVLSLWQSFGYFDAATNADVLRQIRRALRLGGRLVLDVYHRGFFERHQGTRRFEREGILITESKRLRGNRLTVHLTYGTDEVSDSFQWQLFTPDGLREFALRCGFRSILACSDFDEGTPPTPERPRMQAIFAKSG
jgi:SAM-dependent methyltransferase